MNRDNDAEVWNTESDARNQLRFEIERERFGSVNKPSPGLAASNGEGTGESQCVCCC